MLHNTICMYFSMALNASAVQIMPSTVVVKKVQPVQTTKAAVTTNVAVITHRYAADLMPTVSTKVRSINYVELHLF